MYSDHGEVQPQMGISYTGDKGPMFSLMLKTGLLTLVTFGIYRFWQKTRVRKYIWSSVNAGGDTFEYTGTGMEKFLGFLVAIVFLAVYLGIIQMVLFYLGLNVFVDPDTASQEQIIAQVAAIYISIFAVMPFILFAVYRARRYKMARTRYRGIRLGMEKGAWGYVLRAIGYGLLSMATLGILAPLMTFRLEKYMTDRSYYGTTRLRQDGKWTDLYSAMKHVFIALGILILSGIMIAVGVSQDSAGLGILGGISMFVGYVWFFIGAIYYQVRAFGYLMSHKVLGDDVRFTSGPRTGTVIKTYILGGLLWSLLSSVVFGIVFALAMPLIFMAENTTDPNMVTVGLLVALIAVGYLVGIVVMQALSMILITQPILAHYIQTITIVNPEGLDRVHQREALTGIDADGFADALDIGGAI
ncbi:YjgN family protein [Sagittula sp. S175]|uniref:YjgN family protein n=1 Tax=Sagittula sp. S175 TaxID=3415129 RepID=UPI003C7A117E